MLYADAAVSHGIGAADRLYHQANNNKMPNESIEDSFYRHRVAAYMGQNWIDSSNHKAATSEFAALEAWLNRLSTVQQTANLIGKSKNSSIDQLTLDRSEALKWINRIADEKVSSLLTNKFSGTIILPMLSVRLYGNDRIVVDKGKSNIEIIKENIGVKFGIDSEKLEVLNPSLHNIKVTNKENQGFYRLLVPLTTHSVKNGETWGSLAQKYRMDEKDLKKLNQYIQSGQLTHSDQIIVPNINFKAQNTLNFSKTVFDNNPPEHPVESTKKPDNTPIKEENLKRLCESYFKEIDEQYKNSENKKKFIEDTKKSINYHLISAIIEKNPLTLSIPSSLPNTLYPKEDIILSKYEKELYPNLLELSNKVNSFGEIKSIKEKTLSGKKK